MAKRPAKLSRKIGVLTISSTIGAILILGIALIVMFAFFYSQRIQADLHYVLDNVNQAFSDKLQFVRDAAVSMRHSSAIEDFLARGQADQPQVERQLAYSMDFFSDRNRTSQGLPFAQSAYLFSREDSFVRQSYYPLTLAALKQLDGVHQALYRRFQQDGFVYHCYREADALYLCFRIYDKDMRETGVCLVSLQPEAIRQLFSPVDRYAGAGWQVGIRQGPPLLAKGEASLLADMSAVPAAAALQTRIGGRQMLHSFVNTSFGFSARIAIDRGNVYAVLQPTILAYIVMLLAVMLLLSFIVLGASLRFTRPLKQMAMEIGSFGPHHLNVRMGDFPIEEFHEISAAFNRMAAHIDRLITQVYEKELVATRAQVKFLQAQINPHFQFNVLAMLSLKAKFSGNQALYEGLQAFSKLTQGKIFREKEIKIPLAEELELVSFYLLLQKGRFEDKLNYTITCKDEAVRQCLIPRLLIEPLVENAVSHGLEPKSGPGQVDISVWEEAGQLHIVVQDDGIGFDEAAYLRKEDQAPGEADDPAHTLTGLRNTRRLLHILYQDQHQLHIQGEKDVGTRVEVVLPVERSAP